jgi:hypothetical protein
VNGVGRLAHSPRSHSPFTSIRSASLVGGGGTGPITRRLCHRILDFSNWKDKSEFTRKFAKLVEGLDLFYKEERGG